MGSPRAWIGYLLGGAVLAGSCGGQGVGGDVSGVGNEPTVDEVAAAQAEVAARDAERPEDVALEAIVLAEEAELLGVELERLEADASALGEVSGRARDQANTLAAELGSAIAAGAPAEQIAELEAIVDEATDLANRAEELEAAANEAVDRDRERKKEAESAAMAATEQTTESAGRDTNTGTGNGATGGGETGGSNTRCEEDEDDHADSAAQATTSTSIQDPDCDNRLGPGNPPVQIAYGPLCGGLPGGTGPVNQPSDDVYFVKDAIGAADGFVALANCGSGGNPAGSELEALLRQMGLPVDYFDADDPSAGYAAVIPVEQVRTITEFLRGSGLSYDIGRPDPSFEAALAAENLVESGSELVMSRLNEDGLQELRGANELAALPVEEKLAMRPTLVAKLEQAELVGTEAADLGEVSIGIRHAFPDDIIATVAFDENAGAAVVGSLSDVQLGALEIAPGSAEIDLQVLEAQLPPVIADVPQGPQGDVAPTTTERAINVDDSSSTTDGSTTTTSTSTDSTTTSSTGTVPTSDPSATTTVGSTTPTSTPTSATPTTVAPTHAPTTSP